MGEDHHRKKATEVIAKNLATGFKTATPKEHPNQLRRWVLIAWINFGLKTWTTPGHGFRTNNVQNGA